MFSPQKQHVGKANLKFLNSIDPDILQIVFSSHHTAVYVLEMPEQKWYSKGVKGPLFVVRRSKPPYFMMLVLNRVQPKTLIEPITPGIVMQNTEAYLLYQNNSGHINGLWLYDEQAKNSLFAIIQKILQAIPLLDNTSPDLTLLDKIVPESILDGHEFAEIQPSKEISSKLKSQHTVPKQSPPEKKVEAEDLLTRDPQNTPALLPPPLPSPQISKPLFFDKIKSIPSSSIPNYSSMGKTSTSTTGASKIMTRDQFQDFLSKLVQEDKFITTAYSEYLQGISPKTSREVHPTYQLSSPVFYKRKETQ